MSERLLAIYLNDHLGGSTVGVELARRARASHEGTELGAFLDRLTAEIEADRAALERLIEHFGIRKDPVKQGVAWVAEKAGRLKPNGQITGRSPLSTLVELEGLHVGISGKLSMWEVLEPALGPEVVGINLATMAERARRQLEELRPHRVEAGGGAVAPDRNGAPTA
jgi:hypothetical protein